MHIDSPTARDLSHYPVIDCHLSLHGAIIRPAGSRHWLVIESPSFSRLHTIFVGATDHGVVIVVRALPTMELDLFELRSVLGARSEIPRYIWVATWILAPGTHLAEVP